MTATAPRCAAAAATAATTTTPTTSTTSNISNISTTSITSTTFTTFTTSTAAATATTAAAAHRPRGEATGAVFLVEDVERRKTHVDHFLFVKNEALIGCRVQRLRKVRSCKSACASHQRKTQSGGA